MKRYSRRFLAISLVLALLWSLAGIALAGEPERPSQPPEWVPTSEAMDKDRNKIFDDLDGFLKEPGPGKIPIIVLFDDPGRRPDLERAVGPLEVKHHYGIIPGLAGSMTRGQIQAAAKLSFVRQIEYDRPVKAVLDTSTLWHGVQKARADFGVTGDRTGAEKTYTKDDIVIAVIDTGIDPGHQDLDGGKIIAWKDWVNSRTTPYDDNGHGTHVSSIAAGEGDANPAYKGVAPGAALIGLKVLDSAGSGTMSNVTAAIDWAVANKATYGIEILSLSLGASGSSDGTDSTSVAVNNAVDNGLVVVVAAGNEGPAKYTVGSPGAAAKAITVGAMADLGEKGFSLASFSSRGPTADNRTKPDIASPGVQIMAAKSGTTNTYVAYNGTSMATPFTSGTVALMLDANPGLTPAQAKDLLTGSAIDWGPTGQDIDYGFGRLDAYEAVRRAGGFTGTGPTVPGHVYKSDSLTAKGQAKEYLYDITSTSYPVVVTLIMPDWSGSSTPDFDLYLYDPSGVEIGRSDGTTRQETIGVSITQTGTYKVKVYSYAGTGAFFFDLSAGLAGGGTPDNPPSTSIVSPTSGATVSGIFRVKVQATDDKQVSKVEVNIDGGTWVDITANFDGTNYFYDWNTAAVANGNHTVNARATDSAAQVTQATPVTANVQNTSAIHTKTMTGTVTSAARDAWFDVNVQSVGYIDIKLSWSTTADLDFYVYAPNGTYINRAYTTSNPEKLQVFTDQYGTGTYRIKVNLYSGVDSSFTLTVDGYQKQTQTGSVSTAGLATVGSKSRAGITSGVEALAVDSWHNFTMNYTGRSYMKLSWGTTADLDFYVYDPTGAYVTRAYTTNNPETLWVDITKTGTWKVKVNLYSGGATSYTLDVYVPAANLN